jgi:hypothetical protein
MRNMIHPPRHITWSTDEVDLADPFQKRWYLRQILTYGTAADIRRLNLDEVEEQLDQLNLPTDIERLWHIFLTSRHG